MKELLLKTLSIVGEYASLILVFGVIPVCLSILFFKFSRNRFVKWPGNLAPLALSLLIIFVLAPC